ncbi:ShlB/FhaC/HecB family hemolysin secretion/activation protein [Nitrincola sp. MINF-07-Sa-05]|uniref:ShlB/FhaC/HecB family hemolysin secretion/activation protein n=1 Tax=Nitrincola salilacus TaxID=3400273 RepID=UPI0039182253
MKNSPLLRRLTTLTAILLASCIQPVLAQSDDPLFTITGYQITGSTLIDPQILESLANSHTGHDRSFTDIENARAAVQAAFAERGYGAVQVVIPEQEITGADVALRVVEARLASVDIRGPVFHDEANIRNSLPQLIEGASPNTVALSRSLALANENPSKRTAVSLATGDRTGEIIARVAVEDQKTSRFTLGVDNTGGSAHDSTRISATYRNNNLLNRDHQLAAQYITSPENPSDVRVLGLAYRIPLYALGDSIQFTAIHSTANSGTVSGIDLTGRGSILSGRYIHNLRPQGAYNHHLGFGLDMRRYNSGLTLQNSGASLNTRLNVHPISLAYSGAWRTQAHQAGGHMTLVHNIAGGSHGRSADFNANRAGAEPDYTLIRYGAWYNRVFSNNWSASVTFNGQYTDDLLVPVEYFGIGGLDSVRGFHERESAGDIGNRISFEIKTPDLAPRLGLEQSSMRLAWFVDTAHMERKQVFSGEQKHVSLASTGLGLHYSFASSGHMRLDLANVLKGDGIRSDNSQRLHFSLNWSF